MKKTQSVATFTRAVSGAVVPGNNCSTDTIFHYDTRSELIAESEPGGGVYKRELIYLGDISVGAVQ